MRRTIGKKGLTGRDLLLLLSGTSLRLSLARTETPKWGHIILRIAFVASCFYLLISLLD